MQINIIENPTLNFTQPAFSAGNDAIRWAAGRLKHSFKKDWVLGDDHENLFLAALHALDIPTNSSLQCVFALPYDWAEELTAPVCSHYSKNWSIESSKKSLSCRVNTRVFQQGVLALANAAYDWQGNLVNGEILKNSLGWDIGGHTTDFVHSVDRRDSNRSESPINLGMWTLAHQLMDHLKASGIPGPTETEAMDAILTGEYYYKELIKLDLWIHTRKKELAEQIVDEAHSRIGNLDKIPYHYITGGGGKALSGYIGEHLASWTESPYALYDNALGALKLAIRFVKGNDIPVGFDGGFQNIKAAVLLGGQVFCVCFPSQIGEPLRGKII